jgi:hypothetical protein
MLDSRARLYETAEERESAAGLVYDVLHQLRRSQ